MSDNDCGGYGGDWFWPDLPFDPPEVVDPRDDCHIDFGHDDSDGPAWRDRS